MMQVVHAADLAWSEKEERHREGGLAFAMFPALLLSGRG
jgi:hypothetical protein